MHNIDTLFSSNKQDWTTPKELFEELDHEFHFTLDPCSTHENALCEKHYTKEDNGLSKMWKDEIVFCNPPYNKITEWADKCAVEHVLNNATVVLLVPARTDTKWFHYSVVPFARSIRFIQGRLHFGGADRAPFPSMLVIYSKQKINLLDSVNSKIIEFICAGNLFSTVQM